MEGITAVGSTPFPLRLPENKGAEKENHEVREQPSLLKMLFSLCHGKIMLIIYINVSSEGL